VLLLHGSAPRRGSRVSACVRAPRIRASPPWIRSSQVARRRGPRRRPHRPPHRACAGTSLISPPFHLSPPISLTSLTFFQIWTVNRHDHDHRVRPRPPRRGWNKQDKRRGGSRATSDGDLTILLDLTGNPLEAACPPSVRGPRTTSSCSSTSR
jgi:hypothetical protein